ncbi:MAG: protoheme IX farnesyltransferase [Planctomycetes bacterium]|nr:protoheme IX farnesyltransferase [Planctomycetota bacterium]
MKSTGDHQDWLATSGVLAGHTSAASSGDGSEVSGGTVFLARVSDFLELAKFRLSILVLVVTAAGYCYAAGNASRLMTLVHVVFGTALVAFAANAANQIIEREFDATMMRTARRPIPSGRISIIEATLFSVMCGLTGFAYLLIFVNALAASLALATLVIYLTAYTPLKRVTSLNTLVGAIPGAIPPMIGVVAATGRLTADAWLLFGILFIWQLPHFFSIAWLYREDYERGGYRMLSVVDPTGLAVSIQSIGFMLGLIAVSLIPAFIGNAGLAYLFAAATLGYGLLICVIRFAAARSSDRAYGALRVDRIPSTFDGPASC